MDYESLAALVVALTNSQLPAEALTKYVTETTREHRCPMSAERTGKTRATQLFRCRFGGRASGDTSKTDCPCYVKFRQNCRGLFTVAEANWKHNHPVDREFFEAHFSCVTRDEMESVRKQQSLGILPGKIRAAHGILANKDIFYEMRRDSLRQLKSEKMDDFERECVHEDFWRHLWKDQSGRFAAVTFVHKAVASSSYASDFVFLDDTAGTNIYDLPLQVAVVIDAEDRNQVLSFGLLQNKTTESYMRFLADTRELLEKDPRVVVVDRSAAQSAAIRAVFPTSSILYCRVHLRRDLLKHFLPSDDIITGFDTTKDCRTCDQYLSYLNERLAQLEQGHSHASAVLEFLVNNPESWLPSRLVQIGVMHDWSTNRVEGCFGSFKQQFGFGRETARNTCENMMIYSKMLRVGSLRSQAGKGKYSGLTIIDEHARESLGLRALKYLAIESVAFLKGDDNSPYCPWCHLRNSQSPYTLPCRHVLTSTKDVVALDNLHARYYSQVQNHVGPTTDSLSTVPLTRENTYTSIMARIAPFASAAERVPDLGKKLNDFIDELDKNRHELNSGMPCTLAIAGRLSQHPSSNDVLGGHPKQKRQYTCSICGQTGHNRKRCPKQI